MSKRRNILIYPILLLGVMLLFLSSCEKDDDSVNQTNGKTTAVFNPAINYGTMTDQDGNVYKTVTIGAQTWMAENLRTTRYRNGSDISEVPGNTTWSNLKTGAFCNYNNAKSVEPIATYGRLYNWYAVSDTRNLAPTGWHVPTDIEYSQLTDYLGELNSCKLKEVGTAHWYSQNEAATNESGFTALPGGHLSLGSFYGIGYDGIWWSATEDGPDAAWARGIGSGSDYVARNSFAKVEGFSVRCLKD